MTAPRYADKQVHCRCAGKYSQRPLEGFRQNKVSRLNWARRGVGKRAQKRKREERGTKGPRQIHE